MNLYLGEKRPSDFLPQIGSQKEKHSEYRYPTAIARSQWREHFLIKNVYSARYSKVLAQKIRLICRQLYNRDAKYADRMGADVYN